jgi:large subunit ribosomal protein L21
LDYDTRGKLDTLPEGIVKCELTVLEHTKSPLETRIIRKRRKGYQRIVKQKNGWTRLRVGDIILGNGVEQGGNQVDMVVGSADSEA